MPYMSHPSVVSYGSVVRKQIYINILTSANMLDLALESREILYN